MNRKQLNSGWTLRALDGPIPHTAQGLTDRAVPATVPGVVQQDLLSQGVISEPTMGDGEDATAWIGRTSWRYENRFVWVQDGSERHDLVFEGLDTVAAVSLNGAVLGRVSNQHRTYRFDVGAHLHPGENLLVVEFESVFDYIATQVERLGARPKIYPHDFAMVRKGAYHFGWDWGPEVVTVGIWRPVWLESWSNVRIDAIRPDADATGRVRVSVDLELTGVEAVEVECRIGATVATVTMVGSSDVILNVEGPELWWPRELGRPALHKLEVTAGDDRREMMIGFRTVEIDSTPDSHGIPFRVLVNGHQIRIRGVNWIPDDTLPPRIAPSRYRKRIDSIIDVGANLIRLWGGGYYEDDELYRYCDTQGLLLWQDFMFSCAAYPEEEPLWSEIGSEAHDVVSRLAYHPSLAIWNGCNENLWGVSEWGWEDDVANATWGRRYYQELLPNIVGRLDPGRPYIPCSPFSWESADQNAPSDGLTHRWDVWNSADYSSYAEVEPRFVSEFGVQGPAAWSTLHDALEERPLHPDRGQLFRRQKGIDGHRKLSASFANHFPAQADLEGWHWTTQLNQAQAIRFGIERFRAHTPICSGVILWQFNDCWPAISWSIVDSAGVRKPAWYATRAAFRPQLIVLCDDELVFVNDGDEPMVGEAIVARHDLEGWRDSELRVPFMVEPGAVHGVSLPVILAKQHARRGIVTVSSSLGTTYRLDQEPVHGGLRPAVFDTFVSRSGEFVDVEVVARSLVLDLSLLADRVSPSAVVDSSLVTLHSGERHVFQVHAPGNVDDELFGTFPALRCANDLAATTPRIHTVL